MLYRHPHRQCQRETFHQGLRARSVWIWLFERIGTFLQLKRLGFPRKCGWREESDYVVGHSLAQSIFPPLRIRGYAPGRRNPASYSRLPFVRDTEPFEVRSGIGSRLRSPVSAWRSIDGNRDSPRRRLAESPPTQGRTRCAALCPTIRRFDPRPRRQSLSRHTTHRSIVLRSVVGRGEGRMTDRALRPAARRPRASADSRGAIRCRRDADLLIASRR